MDRPLRDVTGEREFDRARQVDRHDRHLEAARAEDAILMRGSRSRRRPA
jgi:hypothetical protein